MSNKKKIIIGIAAASLLAVVVIVSMNRGSGKKGIEVQTVVVERQKLVQTVSTSGKIQPKTQVKISADVSAKIMKLGVKEGNWVEKGDFLVELDREKYVATVERSEAALRSMEANAKLAKANMMKVQKDYERTKELFDKELESQSNLDAFYAQYEVEKARYESALEQVEQSKAGLKQAKDEWSKTTIYAPMSGTVSLVNKEVGEIALGSQFQEDVIMIIANLTEMEALVDVDENDIVSVAIGDTAKIEVDALPDKVLSGIVSEIANSAKVSGLGSTDQKTDFEVNITIIDGNKMLRPGMTTTSDIITDVREESIGIPIQSVTVRTPEKLKRKKSLEEKGGPAEAIADEPTEKEEFVPNKDGYVEVVFVVENGSVTARQVKTGIQSETHIEIIEGLSVGDEVVIGNYRAISRDLSNGSQVEVKNKDDKDKKED